MYMNGIAWLFDKPSAQWCDPNLAGAPCKAIPKRILSKKLVEVQDGDRVAMLQLGQGLCLTDPLKSCCTVSDFLFAIKNGLTNTILESQRQHVYTRIGSVHERKARLRLVEMFEMQCLRVIDLIGPNKGAFFDTLERDDSTGIWSYEM
jgi:hypothetical protein